ncbi:hypothetical protein BTIS_2241 [Bifidobacterium tissieri]|uniref:Uncharacterized protein n=1 Tax=Bifidobacterium tissieri TaxID=1630162 RepID=A0A261F878_9BIFI|nr:hypothetical protein BTIS_2241 [Bifidobacterium tissieri]
MVMRQWDSDRMIAMNAASSGMIMGAASQWHRAMPGVDAGYLHQLAKKTDHTRKTTAITMTVLIIGWTAVLVYVLIHPPRRIRWPRYRPFSPSKSDLLLSLSYCGDFPVVTSAT